MATSAPHISELGGGSPPPEASAPVRDDAALPLCLAVTRGGLGIELTRPLELGPLDVSGLAIALPGLRYPVDLSKGVKQFRSRRGSLQRVVVSVSASALVAVLLERARDVLGEPLTGARVWPIEGAESAGLGVGVHSASRSLAFDLLWSPGDGGQVVLHHVRGFGLECPTHAAALALLGALVSEVTGAARGSGPRLRGRILSFGDVPAELARRLLPELGFRLPSTKGLRVISSEVKDACFVLTFDVDGEELEPGTRVLLALESALQLREADDCLAAGRMDEARRAYLDAFASAPGLAVAARALADIDASQPGRQEAALATLEECGGAEEAGVLGAHALFVAGHVERASFALVSAARAEPFGALAAQLLSRAAQLAEDVEQRVAWLDQAVARAPNVSEPRWVRFEDRVRRGDTEGAVADGQHLEALASGASARHAVCLRVGRRLTEAGHAEAARRFLEKALRYAPDDPAARAALGRLFFEMGLTQRAVALLQGALAADDVALTREGESGRGDTLFDLARALGDGLGDLPQAILRLRQVSARAPIASRARALEAEYCERVGDLIGASRAYARLREAAELGWIKGADIAASLGRAARFEERHGDLAAAERHLLAALLSCPRDAQLLAEYRRVAKLCHEGTQRPRR